MRPFTLCTATGRGMQRNKHYPNHTTITSVKDLEAATRLDHVAATYEGDERSTDRFTGSDCVVMDVDNDHSDKPDYWVTPESLAQTFPGVMFATATSRNNGRPKGEKSARPRFHVYFPVDPIDDATVYRELKQRLASYTGIFDRNALDAARFIYGTTKPEVTWVEGEVTVAEFISDDAFTKFSNEIGVITEGSRNSTMSRYAARVIVRFGDTVQARELFDRKALSCDPPLSDGELAQIWASAQKFGAKVAQTPGYIPPERYREPVGLKPADFTDLGQATVLADEYANRLAYSEATDWLVYNGSFWEETIPGARRIAQELTDRQLEQTQAMLASAKTECDETGASLVVAANSNVNKALQVMTPPQREAWQTLQAAEAYRKYVLKRRDTKALTASLKEAAPMLQITQSDLDAEEFILNTPGSLIDLPTGFPIPHDYNDLVTKQTSVNPGDTGKDLWQAALDLFFQKDPSLIGYVQRIVGLAAIGKVYVEALVIAYGEGRNGKSTFWNTIARVLGTYAGHISADVLTVSNRRNVKPELAEAKGKRLLIAAELEEGMRLSTSNIKQLASTDEIYAEKKYKAPFAFTPSHTLVLYTNHLPRVGALDAGTWRRLIVIPFEAKIEGSQDIKNYAEHLYDNAAPAILQWVIDGARLVLEDDFALTAPPKVAAAMQRYRQDNDWLTHFLEECCETGQGFTEKSGELYSAYRGYAQSVGEYARSTTDFYTALEQAGFTRRKTNAGIKVFGLKIKEETGVAEF